MQRLAARIKGQVLRTVPEAYHKDYGNVLRKKPSAVVLPMDIEDVQEVLAYAHATGRSVTIRGHGCSSQGQSLSDEIILDTTSLTHLTVESGDLIEVGAGYRWGELEDALLGAGLSNGVMVNSPLATVGGTLSVAGFGSRSLRRGCQVEHVTGLDIVLASGERVFATMDNAYSDLFEFTLCGLGQTGVIVGAKLRVEKRCSYTHLFFQQYPIGANLDALAAAACEYGSDHCIIMFVLSENAWRVVHGFDVEDAGFSPAGGTRVEDYYKRQFEKLDELEVLSRGQVQAGVLVAGDEACNLWSDYLLPSDRANEFFRVLHGLFDDPMYLVGFYGIIMDRLANPQKNLPLVPSPQADRLVTLGPYCTVPPSMVAEYKKRFDDAAEACLELGGRVYLYGCHPNREDFYKRQFGPKVFAAWRSVKERYDKSNVLPSYFLRG